MSSLWLEVKSFSRGAASSGYEVLEGRQIMAFLTSAEVLLIPPCIALQAD